MGAAEDAAAVGVRVRHVLDMEDLGPDGVAEVLELARSSNWPRALQGKSAALVFEKPSARTRNAAELAVVDLGGHPVVMRGDEVGLGEREDPRDFARVMAGYHAVIAARVNHHETLDQMAGVMGEANVGDGWPSVPVLNLLSDTAHPTQVVADLMTMHEHFGLMKGLTVAFVGDAANNVSRSLAVGLALVGARMVAVAPPGYQLADEVVDRAERLAGHPVVVRTEDPLEAVRMADVIYADAWTSMGQEEESVIRRRAFASYQVNAALCDVAPSRAIVLHCLPAHRGEEITAGVLDGPRSRVWTQARNRRGALRALFAWMAGYGQEER